MSSLQIRTIVTVVSVFLVAVIGATGPNGVGHLLPLPDSLITPLQALVAGLAAAFVPPTPDVNVP